MANAEQVDILLQGVQAWNQWRGKSQLMIPDFTKAILGAADLRGADLRMADVSRADLSDADLSDADLSDADLRSARLQNATFNNAVLTAASLWETQRAGWSIKKIICERAFWDEEGRATEYGERRI
jgi:uncharacterized protein YjbI with pentapeptide repeats